MLAHGVCNLGSLLNSIALIRLLPYQRLSQVVREVYGGMQALGVNGAYPPFTISAPFTSDIDFK